MIPFLKNKREASMATVDETKMRKPDEDAEFDLIDAVVEDMLEAVHKKDKRLLKAALEALIHHIQAEDELEDAHAEYFEE